MALIDSSTTWTGKEASGFYSLALLTGDSKATFRQMSGVKYREKIASLELGSFLQADACEVSESGDHTIDDTYVEVCDFAFNIPICEKDYEQMYLSATMRDGSNVEQNFPNGLVDYIKGQILDKINASMEQAAWTWSTTASPANLCDGLLKGLLEDNSVVDVASPLTLSESNIVAQLTRIVQVLPTTIKNKPKDAVKIYMSTAACRSYELAIYATHPALLRYDDPNPRLTFAGYEIIETPGLYTSTIVVTDPMNLIYATDLTKDEMKVELVQNPNPGKQKKWNFVGSFKAGFKHIKGSEIVLYGGLA